MSTQRDTPKLIAKWLFYIGCVWAFILVPCLVIATFSAPFGLLSLDLRPLMLAVYIVTGYLIWLGWFWRSRYRGPLVVSAGLWLCSATFNSAFIIWGLATHPERLIEAFCSPFFIGGSEPPCVRLSLCVMRLFCQSRTTQWPNESLQHTRGSALDSSGSRGLLCIAVPAWLSFGIRPDMK